VKKLLMVMVAGLAVAVPTASATTFQLRAGGNVRDRTTMSTAAFKVNFKAGPGHKVMYVDRANGISFRSLGLTSVNLVRNAVKISGVGQMNGMRVPFTAIATDHKLNSGDWFVIGWNHAASHGGKVTFGNIRITPISAS
jgi:hypothetical protein